MSQWRGPDEPQEDIGCRRHPELAGEARPRLTTEREGDPFEGGVQGVAAPCARSDERGQSFREDAAWAARIAAEEAADIEEERDRCAAQRQIGDPSPVMAVDAAGAAMAEWAVGRLADHGGGDGKVIVTAVERIDADPRQMGKEGDDRHGIRLLG